ncbi:poly(ADP-ribose) glycohydrolase domain-containing protein [Ideonella sp. A 288]|uniref:poly(ADP-ribose) glycohydrolase domain-containing protein n=1 Tax=Ideonella sp. A 288 TaxID=1962181 RepID=UPI000B4BD3B5|nr:poly(ADP-ribose) glycohydrolase domain-containing protein [Ideonella sp. A 288]
MPIRRLVSDAEAESQGFVGPDAQRRRDVLRETIAAFERSDPRDRYPRLAAANLARWRLDAGEPSPGMHLHVMPGDWGDVTRALTQVYGECFAVLNMANAWFPGGAYAEGAVAQEENMFRRTDCHFRVRAEDLDASGRQYLPAMASLLNAEDGRVYLDTTSPRVCIRGAEDRGAADLGYPWLPDAEVFPFYELRAAARDLRDGSAFDADDARRRIAAQLDTLKAAGQRHVVLGAFGCGAFLNPAAEVSRLYQDELARRSADFSVVAFAIYAAGYGPDNFGPFRAAFDATA